MAVIRPTRRAADGGDSGTISGFLRGCRILVMRVPGPPHRRLRLPLGFFFHKRKGDVSKEVLYIIGNGFDIHHGINSRYSDFRDYLLGVDNSLHNLITEYIPIRENWSDLEQALADTDSESIIDYASQFLESYGADDWSDAYHHDYQYEIDKIVEGLSANLKTRFTEWVKQLYIPNRAEVEGQIISINKTAKFLSFNYTPTLSAIYGVPKDNILFIHGKAENPNQEIVLGHAWKPSILPKDNLSDEDTDPRVFEGNEIINRYFKSTFKDVESIIKANRSFFASIRTVTNIYILGHSFSTVDIDYFKEIIKNINIGRVKWKISFYGNDELDRHRVTIKELGINDSNVAFCELKGFQTKNET